MWRLAIAKRASAHNPTATQSIASAVRQFRAVPYARQRDDRDKQKGDPNGIGDGSGRREDLADAPRDGDGTKPRSASSRHGGDLRRVADLVRCPVTMNRAFEREVAVPERDL